MNTPQQKIIQYRTMHGKNPSAAWLAVACKITPHEAEGLLGQQELFNESQNEQVTRSEIPRFPGTEAIKVPNDAKPVDDPGIKPVAPRSDELRNGIGSGGDAGGANGKSGGIQPVLVRENEGTILPATSDGGQPELAKAGLIDCIVTKFIGGIKSFVFLSASVGDLALTVFFYISIGFDMPSRIAMGVWAFTQTLGKIYLWHERLDKGAMFAAALSVVATVSIVLAVADAQSIQAVANNNTEKSAIVKSIEDQIKAKGDENKTLQERLANTPTDYVGASKSITNTIKANDEALQALRDELTKAQDKAKIIEKPKFELSTWIIFSQFTNFKWNDPSHVFAFVLILAIAIFFEVLIRATTPRKLIPAKS